MAPAQSRLVPVGLFVLAATAPAILTWLLRASGLLRKERPVVAITDSSSGEEKPKSSKKKVLILHGSTTGTASGMAATLATELERSRALDVKVVSANSYNDENLDKEDVVLFICSTWTDGAAPESAKIFMAWLNDTTNDFRVSKMMLGKVSFAAFGLGGKVYSDNFCKPVSLADAEILKRHI
jgi:sulfite reductase alpha subunit-like flavoprotein